MKLRVLLAALIILAAALLAACNTPAPLPNAPTAIPTLVPATMPAPAAPEAAAGGSVAVSLPAAMPDAPAGEAVYAAKCAGCHGEDGTGKVENARDFTDVDYMRAAVPANFFKTVSEGQGSMPPFKDELSEEERWNVVYYLWHFAVPAAQLAQGKTVYETGSDCASCHGPDGQGAIPQAAKFTPDFIAKYPTTQFYQSVSAGKGIMPAHQDRLSAEDRWAAVEYARSFGYKNASK
jgi:mono/diheme cytochrome c family protein